MDGTWNRHDALTAPALVGGFGPPWHQDLYSAADARSRAEFFALAGFAP